MNDFRMNKLSSMFSTCLLFLLMAAVGLFKIPAFAEPQNILIITADNLGYGDIKSYNPDSMILTPRLDRLATESARLTSFYTASSTCTVSRACLLTGRIPQRHGLDYQLPGLEGNYGVGLNQNEVLIPQVLKAAPEPYVTGCFGKWNIGFAAGSRPTRSDRTTARSAPCLSAPERWGPVGRQPGVPPCGLRVQLLR